MKMLAILSILLLISGCVTKGRESEATSEKQRQTDREILSLEFEPISGIYDINVHGRNHAEGIYIVTARLNAPAEQRLFIEFRVKARRDFWFDDTILDDWDTDPIRIQEGSDVGTAEFTLRCRTSTDNSNLILYRDKFSIAHNQSAVYVETVSGALSNDIEPIKSVTHSIRCLDVGQPDPGTPYKCKLRDDCPDSYWCIKGECRNRPFFQSCTPKLGCGNSGTCVAMRNNPNKPGGLEIVGECDASTYKLPGIDCFCLLY